MTGDVVGNEGGFGERRDGFFHDDLQCESWNFWTAVRGR